MEKSRKPKIRFKGFTDDWEQRKVRDVADRFDNLRIPVAANLRVPGATPYYGANGIQDYVEGFTHDGEFVLVAEDGANDLKNYPVKCVKGRIWVNNHAHVLQGKQNIADNQFLAFSINRADIESLLVGGGRAKLNAETMMDISLSMPNIEEQRIIGQYISTVDNLITLHQRKLDKLVNVKKSMLEKMFPQQGSRIPEIRFCGFTDDWEQRKLVELLTKYTDEVNVPHNGYERLGIRSHAKGTFHSYVSEGHELQTGKMHKVAADKFIVNITFGWEHAVAVTDKNDAGKLVSHRFPQYSLSENLYSKFFKYIILDDKFKHHLWLSSPGGAGRNRVLKLDEMLEYKIKIPNVQEQQKIAEVLMDLDHLITLHQRVKSLKIDIITKKGVLNNGI